MIRRVRHMLALRADRRGAALTEFAVVAPVICLLFVGAFDIGHTLYMRAVMQGIMQKAARDSGLESGLTNNQALDESVEKQAKELHKNLEIEFSRRFYRSFSAAAAAQAEPSTDTNGNGICDAGEPYEDQNNNGRRDSDGADDGQGGAKDSVLYTVTVTYPRMFPLHGFINLPEDNTVSAAMILANQPYGDQAQYGTPTVRNCA